VPDRVAFVGPLDRVLYLRTLPTFERLGPPELGAIAQHARERSFRRGAVLLDPARPVETAYVVIDGQVTIARGDGLPGTAGPSDAVGILELLARQPGGLSAVAATDTLTLELDWEAQVGVCEDYFTILQQYLRVLALRFIHEMRRLPVDSRLGRATAEHHAGTRNLDLVQRLIAVAHARAFSDCNLDALVELARHAQERTLAVGEILWRQRDPATHFALLTAGSLACTTGANGWRLFAGPAFTVGLHEALAGIPRWFEAVAEIETTVLRLEVDPFLDLLEDHFELAIDFTSAIARRVLELEAERRRAAGR